jgi:hypothetical protein
MKANKLKEDLVDLQEKYEAAREYIAALEKCLYMENRKEFDPVWEATKEARRKLNLLLFK